MRKELRMVDKIHFLACHNHSLANTGAYMYTHRLTCETSQNTFALAAGIKLAFGLYYVCICYMSVLLLLILLGFPVSLY